MNTLNIEEEQDLNIKKEDFDESLALILHRTYGKRIAIDFPNPLNDHCYKIRSKCYIGHIPISEEFILRIKPKVPINNIFRMLEYAYNLKSFNFLEGVININSLEDLFENIASILAKRVLDRARKGLYRGYVREEEFLPYVRGRIMVMPTLRNLMYGSTKLDCSFEEHTADLDDNRILCWTFYQLLRFKLKRGDVANQIRQAYRVLSNVVQLVKCDSLNCVNRFYHRLNEDYRSMHGLCRFFLEHCGPGIEEGEHNFIPFLLNMPLLFESFVAEWLKAHLPSGLYITPQYRADLDESGMLSFRIDLVLKDVSSDEVLAVLDTKYKREQKPEESDIEQIVAYAVRMNTKNAFLIYPSSVTKSLCFKVGNVRVQTVSFDVGLDPDQAGNLFLKNFTESLTLQ